MSKIVFFDIDGTLLDHDKKLPSSTKEAILHLQDAGVHVAIATGRAPFMFADLREELGIDSYVSFNGQYVVFEGEAIYQNPLDEKMLERLLEHSHKNGHPLVFMDEKMMKASMENHPYIHSSMGSLKFSHPDYDPNYYKGRPIYQALLFCKQEEEQEYISAYDMFHFVRWHEVSTDVIPFGGSKAEGIKRMVKRMGISIHDVIAFGDGLNDVDMIQYVGTGIAMGNAKEEVKKAANLVTRSVDEDGIAYGLKLVGLL
jgi:Cof subfamily protein (haloacid dehalogenase superfamily)